MTTSSSAFRVGLACVGLALLLAIGNWLQRSGLLAPGVPVAAFWLVATAAWAPLTWRLVLQPARRSSANHRRRFDVMLETAPDAVVAVDAGGIIALANEQAHLLFGYGAGTLVGTSVDALVPMRSRAGHATLRHQYGAAPHRRQMGSTKELCAVRQDGSEFPVDISLSFLPGETGALTLAFIRDTTTTRALWNDLAAARAQAEAEVRERRKLRAVSELLQSLRSRDEVRSVLNLHLEHLFPGTSGAVLALDPAREQAAPIVDWGTDASVDASFTADDCWGLRLGKPYGLDAEQASIPCPHVGGDAARSDYLCVPMLADGETLGVLHLRASGADPSRPTGTGRGVLAPAERQRALNVADRLALPLANIRLREQLREQSFRDGLTGVFNRRFLDDALAREVRRAERHGSPLAVVMLDLDHFKRLNDEFGHDMGDDMLRAFGRFVSARLRDSDLVCRYGGEEFCVICPEADAADVAARLDTLRRLWADTTVRDRTGRHASATFSGGVAAFPRDAATAEALLHAADAALYRAKSLGRNRVVAAQAWTAPDATRADGSAVPA